MDDWWSPFFSSNITERSALLRTSSGSCFLLCVTGWTTPRERTITSLAFIPSTFSSKRRFLSRARAGPWQATVQPFNELDSLYWGRSNSSQLLWCNLHTFSKNSRGLEEHLKTQGCAGFLGALLPSHVSILLWTFAGFALKTEAFSSTYVVVCQHVPKNSLLCCNSALLVHWALLWEGRLNPSMAIQSRDLNTPLGPVCVHSEAVCDQPCFRELHTAHRSATGAEVISEGCGIRMVLQDQKACAISLT